MGELAEVAAVNKWSVDDDVNSDISGVTEVAAANS